MACPSSSPSSNRFWKFSLSAKEDGIFSADIRMASPGHLEKKGFFCFLRKRSISYKEEEGMCDVSLRVRVHLFLLKVRVAAGRLQEMSLQKGKDFSHKLTLVHFKSSAKQPLPCPSSFRFRKRSSSSPAMEGSSSVWSRILLARRKTKESLFVCGAGLGAFTLFLLHHASAFATHFPGLAFSAGSRCIGLMARLAQKYCNKTGSKRVACFMQGLQKAASLFRMTLSLLRFTFVGNSVLTTVLLAIVVGVLLTGKADTVLDRRKQGIGRVLRTRLAMKLLLVMQLLRRFWEHIGVKQVLLFVLLLAFLSNMVSEPESSS